MLVATSYELLKTLLPHHSADAPKLVPVLMGPQQWMVLAIGFITSFFVAFAVVAWFMNWVKRHGFIPFAIYRILLGIAVLVAVFFHYL